MAAKLRAAGHWPPWHCCRPAPPHLATSPSRGNSIGRRREGPREAAGRWPAGAVREASRQRRRPACTKKSATRRRVRGQFGVRHCAQPGALASGLNGNHLCGSEADLYAVTPRAPGYHSRTWMGPHPPAVAQTHRTLQDASSQTHSSRRPRGALRPPAPPCRPRHRPISHQARGQGPAARPPTMAAPTPSSGIGRHEQRRSCPCASHWRWRWPSAPSRRRPGAPAVLAWHRRS